MMDIIAFAAIVVGSVVGRRGARLVALGERFGGLCALILSLLLILGGCAALVVEFSVTINGGAA